MERISWCPALPRPGGWARVTAEVVVFLPHFELPTDEFLLQLLLSASRRSTQSLWCSVCQGPGISLSNKNKNKNILQVKLLHKAFIKTGHHRCVSHAPTPAHS